jgi:hypothetical protein
MEVVGQRLMKAVMRRSVIIAVAFVAIVGVLGAAAAAGKDPRVDQCSVSHYASIAASFDLAHARDFRAHFPAVKGLAYPELDNEDAPAFVAVFNGPLEITSMFTTPADGTTGVQTAPVYASAVCVVVGNVINVYPDMNLTGLQP